MFIHFYYCLRDKGLKVSLNEWMSMMEALDKGLCAASLTDFYQLARAILVKSEVDYDKFDMAFAQYFRGVETIEDIPEEFWNWLERELPAREAEDFDRSIQQTLDLDELKQKLEERIAEQNEEHHGGNYWVGTGGTSSFGHSGWHPGGIRIGGDSNHKSAVKVAGERHFKDFRQDETLGIRQFQIAFRKLRQFSAKIDSPRSELDLDATIAKTCSNAGRLELIYERPRANMTKMLLLVDSGGSMWTYSRLTNQLFQAAAKSNHFKDLQVYYFHNCVYDRVYTDPSCSQSRSIETKYILENCASDYKLIIVGDASMSPTELTRPGGIIAWGMHNENPGIWWLNRLKTRFAHSIWLNPIPRDWWEYSEGAYTIKAIGAAFPMFELTLDGLESGIKKLKVAR